MSETVWSIISSIITVLIIQGVSMWVNKRKVPAEVNKLEADTRSVNGDLIEKYQKVAANTADENLELNKQLKEKEEERKQLMDAVTKLRNDMDSQDKKHTEEIKKVKEEFETKIDDLIAENEKWKDWAMRLSMQIKAWGLVPTPFDIAEAKKNGFSLGEFPKEIK